jgi:hypothetical protein
MTLPILALPGFEWATHKEFHIKAGDWLLNDEFALARAAR